MLDRFSVVTVVNLVEDSLEDQEMELVVLAEEEEQEQLVRMLSGHQAAGAELDLLGVISSWVEFLEELSAVEVEVGV